MPKASIVIPAYNAAAYIGQALDSILTQTYLDFECLVIDDGSVDNTVAVVQQYKDPRIRLIQQMNSGGPAKPRNIGLEHAVGDYVFLFDSDDVMMPRKLQASIEALEASPTADMLFTDYALIDEDGRVVKDDFLQEYDTLWEICGGRPNPNGIVSLPSGKIYPALIKVNFIGTSSVALRRSALGKKNRFNEELKNSDDRLFWLGLTSSHDAIFVDEILHHYRAREFSLSNSGFIRRAPSKIRALEIAKKDCSDARLKAVLTQQIVDDYLSLAYAYRQEKDFLSQRTYAQKALKMKFSVKAIKLIFQSVLKI